MKSKINKRVAGIALIAIIATLIGTTIIYYRLFQSQVRSDLFVSAKLLKDTRYFESENTDIEKIDLSTDIEKLRVTWIDTEGKVLYDNDLDADHLGNHIDRPEIQQAFSKGYGESVRKSDSMKKNTFYYAVLLDNGTVLRVATNAQSLSSVFMSVAPIILLIISCIIILCVTISHMLTIQLIKPIELMAENIEDTGYESPYKELEPFTEIIRKQHTDILSAAKARQDFTANVSHELKTPLTAITGYAELLEEDMVLEDKKKHFYREIRKNAERLLFMINDIIRLSELDRSEKEPAFSEIDLYETVKECIDELTLNATRREVTLNFEGVSCRIMGNREMIKELTENLVQNAIRYNNPGGRVSVSVVNDETPMLIVKDNGIGIPASEQERIFERFYRVDKSRSKETGGTGLGLAIVKHIVEIHNAKLILDSALAVGTTVEVIF